MATSQTESLTQPEDPAQPEVSKEIEVAALTEAPTHPRAKSLPEDLSIDRDEILKMFETFVKETAPPLFVKYYANSPYSGKDEKPFSDMSEEELAKMPAHFFRICKFKKEPFFRAYCCDTHQKFSAQMETHPDMVWGNTGLVVDDIMQVMTSCGYVYTPSSVKSEVRKNYYFKHPDYMEIEKKDEEAEKE